MANGNDHASNRWPILSSLPELMTKEQCKHRLVLSIGPIWTRWSSRKPPACLADDSCHHVVGVAHVSCVATHCPATHRGPPGWPALTDIAAVFFGGGAGAVFRYALGHAIGRRHTGIFPLGTFFINVTGCLSLGLLATVLSRHGANTHWTALLATGFLGGYTTFSTYALESLLLYAEGSRRLATLNLAGSLATGMLAAAAGAGVGRMI